MKFKKVIKMVVVLMLTLSLTASHTLSTLAYSNSINVTEQWASGTTEYGIGDPYIMKYNGIFYLYASTMDGNKGVKCWSSTNMVDWTYEGLCVSDTYTITATAYAPEVTYWNGLFYMYTATPGGEQHRTFTATSPTGPFELRGDTFNFGDDLIDGSIYIDDNEQATKYFFHSGGSCIKYGIMNNDMLTGVGNYDIPNATILGKWTEGPSMFKRNNKYYMTYTGNHVLAENYMIEYAVGDTVTNLKEPTENRLLINTEDGITGLGHNSTVIGPDLDSRYIVYHNLYSNKPERGLNIDRLVFNGEKLEVQGPTWWEVPNPTMPDFYTYMENDSSFEVVNGSQQINSQAKRMSLDSNSLVLANFNSTDDYTAEFNIAITGSTGDAGVVVSYIDENNYAYASISPQTKSINFTSVVNGVASDVTSANLPNEYDYTSSSIKKLTLKKQGNAFDIYVDDRLLISETADLDAGRIGFKTGACTAEYSFTACSSTVNGNEDKDSIKPTGSAMDAVLANETSRNFEIGTINDNKADINSHYVKDMVANDSLSFKINPQQTSYYSADIKAKSVDGAKINILVDGKLVAENISITSSTNFTTFAERNIKLIENTEKITIKVTEGTLDLYSLTLNRLDDIYTPSVTQSDMEFVRLEGNWTETDETLSSTNASVWAKVAYGTEYMGDYEISSDITLRAGSDAGILARLKYATDASDKATAIGGCDSGDYHHAYYAYLTTSGVNLGKQMFDWSVLATKNKSLSYNKTYNLKVIAEGSNIKVYLDNELMIDYTDTNTPIMEGKIGFRTFNSFADFKNTKVTHLNIAAPISTQPSLKNGATSINKNSFIFYSTSPGKGYAMSNGGVSFTSPRMSVKGYLKNTDMIDGTVSCDIDLPSNGYFGTGIIVRCKKIHFGNNTDDLDGVLLQLERGVGRNLNVNVHTWKTRQWKGSKASATLENYFDGYNPKTATLTAEVKGTTLKGYVDGALVLTVDISEWSNDNSRVCFGLRSHTTLDTKVTNFEYTANVSGVSLNKSENTLFVGETDTLTATVSPSGVADKSVVWSSDNTDVATVDKDGNVTAVGNGKATITATSLVDNTKYASCTYNVNSVIPISSISLDSTSKSVSIGEGFKLVAIVNPNNATFNELVWASSNNKVATVEKDGNVNTISTGSTTITVASKNYPNITASCKVTVKPIAVKSVNLRSNSATLTVGKTTQISATVSPSSATTKTITWKSQNNAVATVTNTGKVTAKGVGKTRITATSGGKTATFTVTVKPTKVTNLKLKLKSKNITVSFKKGKGANRTTLVLFRNGQRVKSTNTTKSSFTFKKLKKGTYTVKATAYKKVAAKKYSASTVTSGKKKVKK